MLDQSRGSISNAVSADDSIDHDMGDMNPPGWEPDPRNPGFMRRAGLPPAPPQAATTDEEDSGPESDAEMDDV